MKTMSDSLYPDYHYNGFDNIYQTLIEIIHNRKMVGKICPNMKLSPPCTPLPQYNKALGKD